MPLKLSQYCCGHQRTFYLHSTAQEVSFVFLIQCCFVFLMSVLNNATSCLVCAEQYYFLVSLC
jgi:hypothetical protein